MKKTQKNKQPLLANPKKPEQLTFLEHIYELRSRLFWSVGTLIIASAIGFQFKDLLVGFIMLPLHGQKLVYLTPGGGFSFIFTLCLYFGAFITIPVVVYHLYRFLQPVMGKTSHTLLASLMLVSALLAIIGATFGYFVAIPAAISFLTNFAGAAVTANLTAESYLSFVMAYMFGLAALFQLPLAIIMIDHIRRFPPGSLLSSQRFVVVGAVIAAAIITPTPDVVNQMIIAVPIIAVHQLGVVAVYLRHKKEISPVRSLATMPEFVPIPVPEDLPIEAPRPVVEMPEEPIVNKPLLPAVEGTQSKGFVRQHAIIPSLPTPRSNVQTPSGLMSSRQRGLRSIDGLSIISRA